MAARLGLLIANAFFVLFSIALGAPAQAPLLQHGHTNNGTISTSLFAELEELARIVDIAYCVGTAGLGIQKPFKCASRCGEFENFELVTVRSTHISVYVDTDLYRHGTPDPFSQTLAATSHFRIHPPNRASSSPSAAPIPSPTPSSTSPPSPNNTSPTQATTTTQTPRPSLPQTISPTPQTAKTLPPPTLPNAKTVQYTWASTHPGYTHAPPSSPPSRKQSKTILPTSSHS